MAKQPPQPKSNLPEIRLNPNLILDRPYETGVQSSIQPTSQVELTTSDIPSQYRDNFVSIPEGKTLTAKQLQYQAAEEQTRLGNITSGLWNLTTSFVAGVAKMPGYALGRYGDGWVEGVEGIKESVDSDRYLPESVELGNVWTKLASGAYWSDTVANTFGDSLSYFVPGAVLKSVNIGGKITRLLKLGDLSKPTGLSNALNSAASVTVNTYLESMAEGHEGYKNIKASLEQERAQGLNNFSDEIIEQKASAGASAISRGNIIPLLASNLIFDKLFFSGASTFGKPSVDKIVKAALTGDTAALKTSVLEGFKLSSINPVKSVVRGFQGSPKGFWYRNALIGAGVEGMWEENLQTALQRTIQERVMSGQSPDLFSSETIGSILNKAYGSGFDDEQLESVVLGGLLGVVMSTPGTLSEIKGYNEALVGREAYTPSKFARAFGRQAKPKVEGLVSAVAGIRTGGISSLSSEQFKQAFMDDKGKLDEDKLTKALEQEENDTLSYTAKTLISLKERENLLKNTTEENRESLLRKFAAQDILNSMLPLLTQEQGAEIFSKIVDEMLENKSKDVEEKTGLKNTVFTSKTYAETLKELGTKINKTALRTLKNHNNIIPDYNKVKGADKLDKIQYEQALLNKRIMTNVMADLHEEELSAQEDALAALKDKSATLETMITDAEASNQYLLDLTSEKKELETKELSKLVNQDAVNAVMAEQPGLTVAQAREYIETRKGEIRTRLQEINQELKSKENKAAAAELKKLKAQLEFNNNAVEKVLQQVDETRSLLGDVYVPEKYSDNNIVAAFSGRTFKGIKDLQKALFDPEFVDKDFETYVKNKQLQNSLNEKTNYLKNIKSPFFKALFGVATSSPEVIEVEVPTTDEKGNVVMTKQRRNFYYSANFNVRVLNDARSGFTYQKFTNGEPDAGKSMRLVSHEPASETSAEHLVFKEENYYFNDKGEFVPGRNIFYKLYSDGTLELYDNNRLLKSYEQFEYKLGSDALAEFSFDSDVSILDDAIFNKQIEEHKNVVLRNALQSRFKSIIESTKKYTKKGNPELFNNTATAALESTFEEGATTVRAQLSAFRQLVNQITSLDRILSKTDSAELLETLKKRKLLDAVAALEDGGVVGLKAYFEEITRNFNNVQSEFAAAYKELKALLESPIVDSASIVQETLKTYEEYQKQQMLARNAYTKLQDDLANKVSAFNMSPLMQKFSEHFKSQFKRDKDKLGLIRVVEIMTSTKDDEGKIQDLLDLADKQELQGSTFIQSLNKDLLDADTIESRLGVMGNLSYEEFNNEINKQKEEVISFKAALKEQEELIKKASDTLKEYKNTHALIIKFFNPKSDAGTYYNVGIQKAFMSTQIFEDSDSRKGSEYGNQYHDERLVDSAVTSTYKSAYQKGTALIRTAGNGRDFYYRFVALTEEYLKFKYPDADISDVPSIIFDNAKQIGDIKFDYEELRDYVLANKPEYEFVLDDWRYYAFMQNESLENSRAGTVFVSVANIKSFPKFIQDKIKFSVELGVDEKGNRVYGRLTIAQIEEREKSIKNFKVSSVSDIKALVVRNPKEFLTKGINDAAGYYTSKEYGNDLIYMSIRDYSGATVEDLTNMWFSEHDSGDKNLSQSLKEDRDAHIQFRTKVLTETVPTVVYRFGVKKPGARLQSTQEYNLQVLDALEENTTLTRDLFEFPTHIKNKKGAFTLIGKDKNVRLRNGFLYLKTAGSYSLVKPYTIAETGQVDQVTNLLAALANESLDSKDRSKIFNFLNTILHLRSDKSAKFKDPFYFRINVNPKTGVLDSVEIRNTIITADSIRSFDKSAIDHIQKVLNETFHNFKASQFTAKNLKQQFVEYNYDITTGKVTSRTHASYLDYLFNPTAMLKPKGFVSGFGRVRGVDKMFRTFTINRRDAHVFLVPEGKQPVSSQLGDKPKYQSTDYDLVRSTDQLVSTAVIKEVPEFGPMETKLNLIVKNGKIIIYNNLEHKFSISEQKEKYASASEEPIESELSRYFLSKNNTIVSIVAIKDDNNIIIREFPLNTTTNTIDSINVKVSVVSTSELTNLTQKDKGASKDFSKHVLGNIANILAAEKSLDAIIDVRLAQAAQPKPKEKAVKKETIDKASTIEVGDTITIVGATGEESYVVRSVNTEKGTVNILVDGKPRNISVDKILTTVKGTGATKQKPTKKAAAPKAKKEAKQKPESKISTGMSIKNAAGTKTYTVVETQEGLRLQDSKGKILSFNEDSINNRIQNGSLVIAEQAEPMPTEIVAQPSDIVQTYEYKGKTQTIKKQTSTKDGVTKVTFVGERSDKPGVSIKSGYVYGRVTSNSVQQFFDDYGVTLEDIAEDLSINDIRYIQVREERTSEGKTSITFRITYSEEMGGMSSESMEMAVKKQKFTSDAELATLEGNVEELQQNVQEEAEEQESISEDSVAEIIQEEQPTPAPTIDEQAAQDISAEIEELKNQKRALLDELIKEKEEIEKELEEFEKETAVQEEASVEDLPSLSEEEQESVVVSNGLTIPEDGTESKTAEEIVEENNQTVIDNVVADSVSEEEVQQIAEEEQLPEEEVKEKVKDEVEKAVKNKGRISSKLSGALKKVVSRIVKFLMGGALLFTLYYNSGTFRDAASAKINNYLAADSVQSANIKFDISTFSVTSFNGCNAYVSNQIKHAVGKETFNKMGYFGGAWTATGNLVRAGNGKFVYNSFQGYIKKQNLTKDQITKEIKTAVLSNYNKLTTDLFQEGDIVNLFYEGSNYTEQAYNDGKDVYTSHVGIIKRSDDGSLVLEHNIHGVIKRDNLNDLLAKKVKSVGGTMLVSAITRPSFEKFGLVIVNEKAPERKQAGGTTPVSIGALGLLALLRRKQNNPTDPEVIAQRDALLQRLETINAKIQELAEVYDSKIAALEQKLAEAQNVATPTLSSVEQEMVNKLVLVIKDIQDNVIQSPIKQLQALKKAGLDEAGAKKLMEDLKTKRTIDLVQYCTI